MKKEWNAIITSNVGVVGPGNSVDIVIPFRNLRRGDYVSATPPRKLPIHCIVQARIDEENELVIRICNLGGTPVSIGDCVMPLVVIRGKSITLNEGEATSEEEANSDESNETSEEANPLLDEEDSGPAN